MSEQTNNGHDSACESTLTSHGYTPCQCFERTFAAGETPAPQEPTSLAWSSMLAYTDEIKAKNATLEAENTRLRAALEAFVAAYRLAIESRPGNERPAILAMKAAYGEARATLKGDAE